MYYVIDLNSGRAHGPWHTLVQIAREMPEALSVLNDNHYKIVKEV